MSVSGSDEAHRCILPSFRAQDLVWALMRLPIYDADHFTLTPQ